VFQILDGMLVCAVVVIGGFFWNGISWWIFGGGRRRTNHLLGREYAVVRRKSIAAVKHIESLSEPEDQPQSASAHCAGEGMSRHHVHLNSDLECDS
jgi:hypothetical protein